MPSSLSTPALARVGLRSLQSLSALVALASLCSAFREEARRGRFVLLGSPLVSFALLTSYAAALFGVYALSATPQHALQRTLLLGDLALALLVLAAGLLLATSDFAADCDASDGAVDCATLRTASTSAFVAHAAFLGSAVLAALRDPVSVGDEYEGHEEEDALATAPKPHRE